MSDAEQNVDETELRRGGVDVKDVHVEHINVTLH
jgi:hypothetical protein